jgi:Ca-activated chloride channel family protein
MVYTSDGRVLPVDGKPLATPRVSYLNRTASDPYVQKTAVDGWYYLVVRLGPGDGGVTTGGVPLTIDLAVAGDKLEGPKYATSGAETSPTPSPEDSPSASPSSSATPVASGGDNGSGTARTDDSSSPLPWIIAGAAVILVLVLAVLLVVQRRRKPSQPLPGHLPHQGGPPNQHWG